MVGLEEHSGCKETKDIRILLAEDFFPSQELVAIMLEKAGIAVELANDGRQAVNAFKSKSYDLILMDIEMPGMDGYEATKAIRRVEAGRHMSALPAPHSGSGRIPIIALTGHPAQDVGKACTEAGIDECISKPVKPTDLFRALCRWIHFCPDSMRRLIKTPQSGALQATAEDAPMDFERAILEFEGDEDLLLKVLRDFIDRLKARIQVMRRALEAGNGRALQKEAHAIKGGAANLTAHALAGIASELEEIGGCGPHSSDIRTLEKFEQEFHRLEAYVETIHTLRNTPE